MDDKNLKLNNILIISDDYRFLDLVSSKVVLLRADDNILKATYNNAETLIHDYKPEMVLLCENPDNNLTLDFIKNLRKLNYDCTIILLAEKSEQKFILSAYDAGIDDFCLKTSDSFELVIRIVRNLKIALLKKKLKLKNKLLAKNSITDSLSGLLNYKDASSLFQNKLEKNKSKGIFMILGPSEEHKNDFSVLKLAKSIKKCLRSNDLVTLGNGAKIYIMLPYKDLASAITVFEKINCKKGVIKAGFYEYMDYDNFTNIEENALAALSNAIISKEDYKCFIPEIIEKKDNWLADAESDSKKDFKLFKHAFNKKIENVVTPLFFRLQQIYDEKLSNVKVSQDINEDECAFSLKNSDRESKLKIAYSRFSKVVISVINAGLDSPENTEVTLPIVKLTKDKLGEIIENFIKNF